MIGRIYKIQHLDSSLCYIGSTCNTIRDRWRMHKNAYKMWISNKDKYTTVALYPYLEQFGCDRFQMLLIKEYQIADKKQLFAYEQLAISRTKTCCNQNAALQLFGPKSLAKHYRQLISGRQRDFYQANKATIIKRSRDHYNANKEESKQKAATKITCECGSIVCKAAISKHRKSAKHARLLAALNTQ